MDFQIQTHVNEYLPSKSERVDAIITVSAKGDVPKTKTSMVFGFIIDCSGSMDGQKIVDAVNAARTSIDEFDANDEVFIVRFTDVGKTVLPLTGMDRQGKMRAHECLKSLTANGGTCMEAALKAARTEFAKRPESIRRALFLTDGQNNNGTRSTLYSVIEECKGVFEADCRGIGSDWEPKDLMKIAEGLLGTAKRIDDSRSVGKDFKTILESSRGKRVSQLSLRLWTPKVSEITFVKQASAPMIDLTKDGKQIDPRSIDFNLGSWGDNEERDFHVSFKLPARESGDEMIVCRPSIIYKSNSTDNVITSNPVVAKWSDDTSMTACINEHVAHYTGQAELASSIKEGLEALNKGDEEASTRLLGRAMKLAKDSGNDDTTNLLKKVVDVDDATGTFSLRRAKKGEMMDLELGATQTIRMRNRTKN